MGVCLLLLLLLLFTGVVRRTEGWESLAELSQISQVMCPSSRGGVVAFATSCLYKLEVVGPVKCLECCNVHEQWKMSLTPFWIHKSQRGLHKVRNRERSCWVVNRFYRGVLDYSIT